MITRRWLGAAAAVASGLGAYALMVEPRWVQLRRTRVHIAGLPPGLDGLRVGLLTDLHVSGRSARLVQRAVSMIMAARPDLIALTGDLAEDAAGLRTALDSLSALAAPLGVHAVPGNHDHEAGIEAWHAAVGLARPLRDLTNRHVLLPHRGTTVCVAGVDDPVEGRPRLRLPPPGTRDVTILLAHSPDEAERCRRRYDDVDLILSGHTHGGQVRLPLLGAPVRKSRHPDLYDHGLRRRPWTQVYTSRGLGTARLPVRFLARPEVALLELTGRPRSWIRGRNPGILEPPSDAGTLNPHRARSP